MKARRENVLSDNNISKKEKRTKVRAVTVCLVLGIVIFGSMLFVASNILGADEYVNVVVTTKSIKKGTKITSDNCNELLKTVKLPMSGVPTNHFSSTDELAGYFTTVKYDELGMITTSGVASEKSMTEMIKNPVEVSISLQSLDAAVGGILREGDYINIYSIQSGTDEKAILIMENAYITKALDSSGHAISRSDSESTATILNLLIPKSIEQRFNAELTAGTLRIGLVVNPDIKSIKENVSKVVDTEDNSLNEDSSDTENSEVQDTEEATTDNSDNKTYSPEEIADEDIGNQIEVDGQFETDIEEVDNYGGFRNAKVLKFKNSDIEVIVDADSIDTVLDGATYKVIGEVAKKAEDKNGYNLIKSTILEVQEAEGVVEGTEE